MKKITLVLGCLLLVFAFSTPLIAKDKGSVCTTIQDGTLVDTAGEAITTGYDKWGYNYQGHMFNGIYDNYTRPSEPVTEGDSLMMKWNDAWLSNMSCDGDKTLDRHYGFLTYRGSGAWLTNHIRGTDTDDNGQECEYEYFCKIVAAPIDAVLGNDGIWYTSDGTEIGPAIWGDFAIIQEINSGSCGGLKYISPIGPGLGKFKP